MTAGTPPPQEPLALLRHAVEELARAHPDREPVRLTDDVVAPLRFRGCAFGMSFAGGEESDWPAGWYFDAWFHAWPGRRPSEGRRLTLPSGRLAELYNVLQGCQTGVRLMLTPGLGAGSTAIMVEGVRAWLPFEAVSALRLLEALTRLHASAEAVYGWLVNGEGDDHWSRDEAASRAGYPPR